MERVEEWKQGEEFSKIFAKCSISGPYAMLHIAPEYTLLALGTKAAEPDAIRQFDIGMDKMADEFFSADLPTAGEVENAIVAIEDAIMPVSKQMPPGAALWTTETAVGQVVEYAAYTESEDGRILTRTALESLFGRTSAVIMGRPASVERLPVSKRFTTVLLIVREIMFHLDFHTIRIIR